MLHTMHCASLASPIRFDMAGARPAHESPPPPPPLAISAQARVAEVRQGNSRAPASAMHTQTGCGRPNALP